MERAKSIAQTGRGVMIAPLTEVLGHLGEWHRRRQMRKTFGLTTERLLKDIGLTQDDLLAALDGPLEEDAADAMLKAALARAGNW